MFRPPLPTPRRATILALACLLAPLSQADQNSIGEIDSVRENLSQALQYRDQAAKEQFAWELRQGEMENLLLVAQEEKKSIEAAIAAARPILADLSAREDELAAQDADSKTLGAFLRTAAPALAAKTLAKSAAWPEPLRADASAPLHQISAILKQAPANQNLETLVQSSVEALEKALVFQNKIHFSSAYKTLPDGRDALFDVLFIGLGGGYYFSADQNAAGKIAFRDGAWTWTPQDDLVEPLRAFAAIANQESPATWVSLPVTLALEGAAQ